MFIEPITNTEGKKVVTIELPQLKALSRNETLGHYFNYRDSFRTMYANFKVFAKRFEFHFDTPVDVYIDAYYDTRVRPVKCSSKNGQAKMINRKLYAADTPNIDDKIFTDLLTRWENKRVGGKMLRLEKETWFIEDDQPAYLRRVIKQSIPSDHYKVVMQIVEV